MTSKSFQVRNDFYRGSLEAVSRSLPAAVALLLAGASPSHGWLWRSDMKNQPSIRAQEAPRPSPANSVSRQRKEPRLDRVEAGKRLRNPVEPSANAMENGKKLYGIYCALCHGTNGRGGGPVAGKFVPPPDLTLDVFRNRPDGFLYQTIADGGPLMPGQGDALQARERWEIVIYLRRLQRGEK